jgi:hypothetical protein
MLLTLFAALLLALGSFIFSSDAQNLVLRPIENMVQIVEIMAKDPLQKFSSSDNSGLYETRILENTVKKIGSLLRIGFGEISAHIVTENLKKNTFDLVCPGKQVYAIFGYCKIQQFDFIVSSSILLMRFILVCRISLLILPGIINVVLG